MRVGSLTKSPAAGLCDALRVQVTVFPWAVAPVPTAPSAVPAYVVLKLDHDGISFRANVIGLSALSRAAMALPAPVQSKETVAPFCPNPSLAIDTSGAVAAGVPPQPTCIKNPRSSSGTKSIAPPG